MRHRAPFILLVVSSVGTGVVGSAAARPFRVDEVPNGPIAACLTCHEYPGGPRNAFGQTVEHYGGVGFLVDTHVQWGNLAIADPAHPLDPPKTLAEIDSDGDGRTNGEELLDPARTWSTGQPQPGNPALVRLPGRHDAKVVIRQVYPGAAATGTYRSDFIELYNRSTEAVSLGGWSIQYAPANGPGNFGADAFKRSELPSVLLGPGQSYLIQEASAATGTALPGADLVDETPIALGDLAGKVALVSTTASVPCNGFPAVCSEPMLAQILDLVSYGNAIHYEGMGPAPTPSSSQSLSRARDGCTDINNNGPDDPRVPPDFTLTAPTPRASSSPLAPCGGPAPPAAAAVPALGGVQLAGLLAALAALGLRRTRLRATVQGSSGCALVAGSGASLRSSTARTT